MKKFPYIFQNRGQKETAFPALNDGINSRPGRAMIYASVFLVFFAYFLSLYLPGLAESFSEDESQWVLASQVYFSKILNIKFKEPECFETYPFFEKYYPKLAVWLMASSLYLGGELGSQSRAFCWDWEKTFSENNLAGTVPGFRTLFFGRLFMPFLAALGSVAFLIFMSRQLSLVPAMLSSIFLGRHWLVERSASAARLDIAAFSFGMFLLAFIICINWRKVSRGARSGQVAAFAAAGLMLGLSASTKQNYFALLVVWVLFMLWVIFSDLESEKALRKAGQIRMLLTSSLALMVAAFVFLGVNSLFAPDPSVTYHKIRRLFKVAVLVYGYKGSFSESLYTPFEKIESINFFVATAPFRTFLPGKINYNAERLLYENDPYYLALKYLLLFLFLLGFFIMAARMRTAYAVFKNTKSEKSEEMDRLVLAALVVVLVFISNFIWLPLAWDRYYIPILLSFSILLGFALDFIFSSIKKKFQARP